MRSCSPHARGSAGGQRWLPRLAGVLGVLLSVLPSTPAAHGQSSPGQSGTQSGTQSGVQAGGPLGVQAGGQPGGDAPTGDPAADTDYDADSPGWNGLNTLTAVARGLGLQVQAVSSIDWTDLGEHDIVFVLYPEVRLDPAHMVSFIRNGGQLLIADDFGDSTEVLGRLGMLRKPAAGVHATRYYRDLEHVPLATPVLPEHPLAVGVDELATNVPGVLVQVRGAEEVFRFGQGETVVATGSLGQGSFVVVSDPSVFINRMLQFQGNMRFCINAIRYLSKGGQAARLVILAREFSMYGEPAAALSDGSMDSLVSTMTTDVNRMLEEGNDYLLTELALRVAAVLLAVVVAFLVLMVVPSLRGGSMDGSWAQATAAPATPMAAGFEKLVAQYDGGGRDTNYVFPATIMRDAVNSSLGRALGMPDPLYGASEPELVAALTESRGPAAASALQRVYKRLHALPSRAQAASRWGAGYVARRDFQQLHRDVDQLYLALGEQPDLP